MLHNLPVIICCHSLHFLFVPVGDTKCGGQRFIQFFSYLLSVPALWLAVKKGVFFSNMHTISENDLILCC